MLTNSNQARTRRTSHHKHAGRIEGSILIHGCALWLLQRHSLWTFGNIQNHPHNSLRAPRESSSHIEYFDKLLSVMHDRPKINRNLLKMVFIHEYDDVVSSLWCPQSAEILFLLIGASENSKELQTVAGTRLHCSEQYRLTRFGISAGYAAPSASLWRPITPFNPLIRFLLTNNSMEYQQEIGAGLSFTRFVPLLII